MILGVQKLEKELLELSKMDLRKGIEAGISIVQEAARGNCRSFRHSSGELRESIFTSIEEEGDIVRGICYTNKSYGPYVEFGTGPKGQASHEGISPDVAVAYSQSPWWIHEGSGPNEIDRATAEYYHFPYIDTPKGRFYQCSGQAAHPFMYPALKNNEEEVLHEIKKVVRTKK